MNHPVMSDETERKTSTIHSRGSYYIIIRLLELGIPLQGKRCDEIFGRNNMVCLKKSQKYIIRNFIYRITQVNNLLM